MLISLIHIIGIDREIALILQKNGIQTIKQFYDATRTESDRYQLAEKTKFPIESITYWAIQAELLRLEGMSPEDAVELIEAGIYGAEQLRQMDPVRVCEQLKNNKGLVTLSRKSLETIQKSKLRKALPFEFTGMSGTLLKPLKESEEEITAMDFLSSDLSEIIASLGDGIAKAQKKLDESSIEIQNQILADDTLAASGINASWYVIPEVEFNLKMQYSITQDKTTTKLLQGKRVPRVNVIPSNAKYNNLFHSEKSEESSLRVRFVPVPPSENLVIHKVMPNLVGRSKEEMAQLLEDNNIDTYIVKDSSGEDVKEGINFVVEDQSPNPGKYLLIGETPVITVVKL